MEMAEDAKKIPEADKLEQKRKERLKTVLDALERGLKMPDPKAKTGLKADNAHAMLCYYYLTSGRYGDAIRAGDKFARESKSGPAAAAAAYVLQAYGASIAEREANLKAAREFRDDQGQRISEREYTQLLNDERSRMLDFAAYCEATWDKDLAGNLARHQLALLDLRNGRIAEGLKKLNAINKDYPSYTAIQYQIADVSLKAAADDVEPFADPARGEKEPVPFRDRGLTALRSISEPNTADEQRIYFQAKTRLGFELYRDKKFAEMEPLVAPLLQKVAATSFHDNAKVNGELREYFGNQLHKISLLAKVGQAAEDFNKKPPEYKKVADLAAPVVTLLKDGKFPLVKDDPQVSQSLQALLSMALTANVQLGDLDKVRLVVDVYGKAVGEDPDKVVVPEIMRRLVPLIRGQVRELKARSDADGLKKAATAFTAILTDLKQRQKKMPTPPEFLLVLAQCYGSLDQTDEALKLLDVIPQPADDNVEAQRIYQGSCLAKLRLLREQAMNDATKREANIKKAGDLLNEYMGTKDKPGWAVKSLDAHMERLYLYEMEDNTGGGFNKAQALVKTLASKNINPNDVAMLSRYLECNYYMVYFLYANGKKNGKAGVPNPDKTRQAAEQIVELENQYKDFGTPEMKKKFRDLLEAEPPLKAAYDAKKKQ
jgi:hypothetical protein